MTLRVCLDCTTAYAVGVPRCPHCGSERGEEMDADPYRGDNMPKISKYGGATVKGEHGPELVDPPEGAVVHPEPEGGDGSSPGSSSETSSSKPLKKPEPSSSGTRKRARTTGSRSGKARTGSSTAPSTDGSPEAGSSDSDTAE